jgi:hypothetical protein
MGIVITNNISYVSLSENNSLKTFIKNAYNIYFDGKQIRIVNANTEKTVFTILKASNVLSIYDAKTDTYPSIPGTLMGLADMLVTFFFRRLSKLPAGGETGQVLALNSSYEFDASWVDPVKEYKIYTKPQGYSGGNIAYTGFSEDLSALTSEGKWAVKKMLESGTETWSGKTTFDKILDDYLSLSYS